MLDLSPLNERLVNVVDFDIVFFVTLSQQQFANFVIELFILMSSCDGYLF